MYVGNWVMSQTWKDLLFLHYPVPKGLLRSLVPNCFELDLYENQAWLSVVPFYTSSMRGHFLPKLPFTPTFPELNVRTYIRYNGEPGVYFFSLDADSQLAVTGARFAYGLPYFYADMTYNNNKNIINFRSERKDRQSKIEAVFSVTYQPTGNVFRTQPGTLEQWLTDRFLLFTVNKKKIYKARIKHPAWPLQKAEATINEDTLTKRYGNPLPRKELTTYCKELTCKVWPSEKVGLSN